MFNHLKYPCPLLNLIIIVLPIAPLLAYNPQNTESWADDMELVWESVTQSFPMTELQEKEWSSIRKRSLRKAKRIRSEIEFVELTNNVFDQMGVSHFKLYGTQNQILRPQTNDHVSTKGHLGFEIRWIDGKWYVDGLDEHHQAYDEGIRNGDQLISVNAQKLISKIENSSEMILASQPRYLFGQIGNAAKVSFKTDNGKKRTIELDYVKWSGIWTKPIGNFPSLPAKLNVVEIENITVIRFDLFSFDFMQSIVQAIKNSHDRDGIIFDLRGNRGGLGFMANGIVGHMSNDSFRMGTMYMKEGTINFHVFPQHNPYLGKVAVIIDRWSASTTEIFASGIQESGRGKVFGETSMGAALPSKFSKLPNGMVLQQAIATLVSANGRSIENEGVVPDYPIEMTKQDLIQGNDPLLSAALEWIKGR